MEEENKRKADVDHAALVDAELPVLEAKARVSNSRVAPHMGGPCVVLVVFRQPLCSLHQAGQLQAATEQMLALEKKCRQSNDSDSTL